MRSSATKTILYTFLQERSFVQADLTHLSKHHNVRPYHFQADRKWLTPLILLRQALYLLVFGWRYQYMVCFFAGYHSVLPTWFAKATGKKSIIILGGTDCYYYPSFHYGNFTKPLYGYATCLTASAASVLVPVSSNLIYSASTYYREDSIEQGIFHWCKKLRTPYQVISTEYNPELFRPLPIERVDNSFITVAFNIVGTSFVRKGIDKFIMIAAAFPQYRFTIVGSKAEEFPVPIPPNITLIAPVPHHEVPALMSAHQFYLQLSIAEGLPNALCEAMLCECIPIGSAVAAIPEAISTHGFLVHEREDAAILEVIRSAIALKDKAAMGKSARNQIISNYGPGKRFDALMDLFN